MPLLRVTVAEVYRKPGHIHVPGVTSFQKRTLERQLRGVVGDRIDEAFSDGERTAIQRRKDVRGEVIIENSITASNDKSGSAHRPPGEAETRLKVIAVWPP